jgi:hypothetical protein
MRETFGKKLWQAARVRESAGRKLRARNNGSDDVRWSEFLWIQPAALIGPTTHKAQLVGRIAGDGWGVNAPHVESWLTFMAKTGRTFGEKGSGCSMNTTNVVLHTPPVAEAENRLVYGQFVEENSCCPCHFYLKATAHVSATAKNILVDFLNPPNIHTERTRRPSHLRAEG